MPESAREDPARRGRDGALSVLLIVIGLVVVVAVLAGPAVGVWLLPLIMIGLVGVKMLGAPAGEVARGAAGGTGVQAASAPISAESGVQEPAATSRVRGVFRVLIVKDELVGRKMLEKLFRDSGSEVMGAGTVSEALSMFDATPPQLIISDLSLQDAFELVRQVRLAENGKRGAIPILALTPELEADDRARLFAAGISRTITRPVAQAELMDAAVRLLEME